MMRLRDTLLQCAEIERRIASVYERFARRWRGEPEVGDFWTAIATEEQTHAIVLEAAAEYLSQSRCREAIDPEALAIVRGYVTAAVTFPGPVTLRDAFRTALDLETLELDRLYTWLVQAGGNDFRQVSRIIGASLDGIGAHQQALIEMIERFSNDPALRAEAKAWGEEIRRCAIEADRSPEVFSRLAKRLPPSLRFPANTTVHETARDRSRSTLR